MTAEAEAAAARTLSALDDYGFYLPARSFPPTNPKKEKAMTLRTNAPVAKRSASSGTAATQQRKAATGRGGEEADRRQMIAEAAYYHAERRGFVPGHELNDWLLAEADVEHALGPSA